MAKLWKKIGLVILIIACVFCVVSKLVKKLSFNDELVTTADYVQTVTNEQANNLVVNEPPSNVSDYTNQ